ncbi:FAD-binding oxidoreductase [Pseudomonas protegens]|uniref:FAD-binding oxidoreductase n=1 Tax=Pseudomonas protegens TaxID=380021 RepID=UPI0009B9E104|nr:FAD-binding oxidoreductase [Pseudomonas protegens]
MSNYLNSWGRYPNRPQSSLVSNWRTEVAGHLIQLTDAHGDTLPYGNGRSYGDSCLAASDHVLNMRTLDRFINADWEQGTITAEAGITLAEILSISIQNGWFLSVTPGTQFVTLGGAIANDVHGKNHHIRGTFGNHVYSFGLQRSNEEPIVCSATENRELFAATIGGLGLTGVITWAKIQLIKIRSSQIDSVAQRFDNLSQFFSLSEELDHQHEYSVAWIDCLASGSKTGRGVFIVGDHSQYGSLETEDRPKLHLPVTPPLSLINNLSLRAFNETYWRMQPSKRKYERVEYEPFFYPLDRILHWNRMYGRKGFQQFQCVVPKTVAEPAVQELLKAISLSGQGSFLAVLKCCGSITSPGMMSFPMPGTSLALDFPNTPMLERVLFPQLDKIVREAGGRLYPAKDAHMSGNDFRQAYPAWERLEALRDKGLMSRFWKRVIS